MIGWLRLRLGGRRKASTLLAMRQDDLEQTLEKLEADRQGVQELSTLELAYHLADASYLAGWWREWGQFKLEDRRRYITAMAAVEDYLEELEGRLQSARAE